MKKNKHSWLFIALTLVLGMAVLTTTLAAPSMGVVKFEDAVTQQSISDAAFASGELASFESAGTPELLSAGAASSVGNSAGQSSDISPQSVTPEPSISRIEVYGYSGDDDTVPMHRWSQTDYVDIFENYDFDVFTRDTTGDYDDVPTTPDPGGELNKGILLIPGQGGTYTFILENSNDFAVDWSLHIGEEYYEHREEKLNKLPLEFQLSMGEGTEKTFFTNGSDPVDTWYSIDDLDAMLTAKAAAHPDGLPFPLGSNQDETCTLYWRWVFEVDEDPSNPGNKDIQNQIDTDLGLLANELTTMPYYRLLFDIVAEAEVDDQPRILTIIWSDKLTGREYGRWVIHLDPSTTGIVTMGDLKKLYDLGDFPVPEDVFLQSLFNFLGYYDENGVLIDDNYEIDLDLLEWNLDTMGLELEASMEVLASWDAATWVKLLPLAPIAALTPLLPLVPLLPFLPLLGALPLLAALPLIPLLGAPLLLLGIPLLLGLLPDIDLPDIDLPNINWGDDDPCDCDSNDCNCCDCDDDDTCDCDDCNPSSTSKSDGKKPSSIVTPPKTGDTFPIGLFFTILMLCLGAAMAMLYNKKRRTKAEL